MWFSYSGSYPHPPEVVRSVPSAACHSTYFYRLSSSWLCRLVFSFKNILVAHSGLFQLFLTVNIPVILKTLFSKLLPASQMPVILALGSSPLNKIDPLPLITGCVKRLVCEVPLGLHATQYGGPIPSRVPQGMAWEFFGEQGRLGQVSMNCEWSTTCLFMSPAPGIHHSCLPSLMVAP